MKILKGILIALCVLNVFFAILMFVLGSINLYNGDIERTILNYFIAFINVVAFANAVRVIEDGRLNE